MFVHHSVTFIHEQPSTRTNIDHERRVFAVVFLPLQPRHARIALTMLTRRVKMAAPVSSTGTTDDIAYVNPASEASTAT